VTELRAIADEVGATLLYDAAHLSGLIAGNAWQQPLALGAHVMTMSTYKSLAGPPGGLILTDDADLAQKLDAIAFPGLTANFDAGRCAALAITLLDWQTHGRAYAAMMRDTARALAEALAARGVPVFAWPPASPPRTSSPSRRQPSAAARPWRGSCGAPTSSPPASACRCHRSRAT
jgi:glycine hydroxymethyltransferase